MLLQALAVSLLHQLTAFDSPFVLQKWVVNGRATDVGVPDFDVELLSMKLAMEVCSFVKRCCCNSPVKPWAFFAHHTLIACSHRFSSEKVCDPQTQYKQLGYISRSVRNHVAQQFEVFDGNVSVARIKIRRDLQASNYRISHINK